MNLKVNKNSIKVTNISNEAELEVIDILAATANSEYEMADYSTTAVITTNLKAFVKAWNSPL
jgi:hypothetical protein